MTARNCARPDCDLARAADIHSRHHEGGHVFVDATVPGLKPMSAGMRAYRQSEEHKESYSQAESYCVGHALDAPGRCFGPLTPHHTAPRGAFGGQRAAEREGPVVTLCSTLNDAVQSDPKTRQWALTHSFVRAGVSHPFLLSAKATA